MSNYIITAVELVKIMNLEPTDENIIKYTKLVAEKSKAEKAVDAWILSIGKGKNDNSSDH